MRLTPDVTTPTDRIDRYGVTSWLTGAVGAGTLAVSVAALASPALMQLLTRNLAQLRAGQWWRAITPILVQPDGWGQLVFNLLGIIVVGAALEHHTNRTVWSLTYLLAGIAGIAAISGWHPGEHGGGSSDAVAALIGALTVLLAAENHNRGSRLDHRDRHGGRLWADLPAQVYCVFFAGYLTALDLGGVWWSILAGDAAIAAFLLARRALSPASLTRACLFLVGVAGVTMTGLHDGHGIGILSGAAIASLALLQRHTLTARHTRSHAPACDL